MIASMSYRSTRTSAQGFTLLELAVVLFVLGLLIAGLFGPLETQLEARDRRATETSLNQALEALYGFAVTHGRLPCPDTDGDGIANPVYVEGNVATANCTVLAGFLPWSELSVPPGDAWGNRFLYAVSNPAFTLPDTNGLCDESGNAHFDLCTEGSLTVQSRGDNPATGGLEGKYLLGSFATRLPAVVLSHGRNGWGATGVDGTVRTDAPGGTDEAENDDANGVFVTRNYSRGASGCDENAEGQPACEFDDIVGWIAPTILNARMTAAGRLP